MSETPDNAALAELLRSISDRKIRRKVQKLLQYGEEAVRSLGELDAALYFRENGEEQLQIVADAVLGQVRRLLEFLGMIAPTGEVSRDGVPELIDFEFSTDVPVAARASDDAPRAAAPGAGTAPGLIPQRSKTDEDKWLELAREMDALQYGLGSELKEFDRRFAEALRAERKEQAVRDLNDATTSLMDGVFAVMTSVYECFLGYAEPERMIPGHRDTLGKALAIRRSLADLRREVQELNRSIQNRDSTALVADTSYRLIVESLVRFIASDTFSYMRSDDRKEFEHFRELLSRGDATRSRHECEGFDKYLDSLAFVSQRGVVLKHDADLRAKIHGELRRALPFVELFPDLVRDVIHEAFLMGDRLFGLNDQLDQLVDKWSRLRESDRTVEVAVAMARELARLVQPAESAAAPASPSESPPSSGTRRTGPGSFG